MDKNVTLKIVSLEGDTTVTGPASEMLLRMQTEVDKHGKWAFAGGRFITPGTLTAAELGEFTEPIVLTNALAGG
jgi:hypothetical protein